MLVLIIWQRYRAICFSLGLRFHCLHTTSNICIFWVNIVPTSGLTNHLKIPSQNKILSNKETENSFAGSRTQNLLPGAEIQCPFSPCLETVRNRGVRIGEVRLYCNSVLVDFLVLFSFNYFQVQGKHNPFITFSKNFFHFSRVIVTQFICTCKQLLDHCTIVPLQSVFGEVTLFFLNHFSLAQTLFEKISVSTYIKAISHFLITDTAVIR